MDWHLVQQFKDCIVTIKIWNRKPSVEFALITLAQITRQKDWNLIEHLHSVESIISPPHRTEIGSVVTACIFPQCEKTVFSSCDRESDLWFWPLNLTQVHLRWIVTPNIQAKVVWFKSYCPDTEAQTQTHPTSCYIRTKCFWHLWHFFLLLIAKSHNDEIYLLR